MLDTPTLSRHYTSPAVCVSRALETTYLINMCDNTIIIIIISCLLVLILHSVHTLCTIMTQHCHCIISIIVQYLHCRIFNSRYPRISFLMIWFQYDLGCNALRTTRRSGRIGDIFKAQLVQEVRKPWCRGAKVFELFLKVFVARTILFITGKVVGVAIRTCCVCGVCVGMCVRGALCGYLGLAKHHYRASCTVTPFSE